MVRQYVGARYVPKFADPVAWASGTSYEAMTIVTYNNSSYTSKMPVPPTVGNPADNPDYWALTGNYNAQVEQYRQETETVSNNLTTEITNLKNADTTLQGQITTEITNRETADATLHKNIEAEATTRQTANNILQGNINSEAATRASADSNLQSQINQIVAPSGEAPSAAEVQNARIGADGVTYDTLGDAIRTQVGNLKDALELNEVFRTGNKIYNTISGEKARIHNASLNLIDASKIAYDQEIGLDSNHQIGQFNNNGWCSVRSEAISPSITPGKTYIFTLNGTLQGIQWFYLKNNEPGWTMVETVAVNNIVTFTIPENTIGFAFTFWYRNNTDFIMCEKDLYKGYIPFTGYTITVNGMSDTHTYNINSETVFPLDIELCDYYSKFTVSDENAIFNIEYNTKNNSELELSGKIDQSLLVTLLNAEIPIKLSGFVSLTSDVAINANNVRLIGDGKIESSGESRYKLTISNPSVTEIDTKASLGGNKLTLSASADLSVGDTLIIGDSASRLIACVASIDGNVITLSEEADYKIVNDNKVYKLPKTDINITGIIFNNIELFLTGQNGCAVDKCLFDNGAYLSFEGTCGFIHNNRFMRSNGLQMWSAFNSEISGNHFENSITGIRCTYVKGLIISDNIIENNIGDIRYTIGIELSVDPASFHHLTENKTMACYCVISNNIIKRATLGLPGSAIGGIHLNNGAHHNTIEGNICEGNSKGIYLENSASYNRIIGNDCCRQTGYYGVGIEVDWDGCHNVITNNTCNYNKGSVTADESCGIEIRGGKTGGHTDKNNVISNNTCVGNGKCGLYLAGSGIIVIGNTTEDNGTDEFNSYGGIILFRNESEKVIICNNIIDDNIIEDGTEDDEILIKDNIIKGVIVS